MRWIVLLFSFFTLLLTSCGTGEQIGNRAETTITGYILEIGDRILVNELITGDEFDTKTGQKIYDEYYYSSIFFSISSIDKSVISKLEVGQKVKIVVDGEIAESAPAQAKASKVAIIEE
ncbi:DUF3221 domain-containing protein [Fredinandcohnia onubensis]|uniref:DUF3221 domain-containing protein n=1 Tax=Fredinandcohnia onubensis TaxID=1571209 RepID=UPI000C0BECB6|nr:DUF3221 domain-containing protein [Fredinandcohnia onubensis]